MATAAPTSEYIFLPILSILPILPVLDNNPGIKTILKILDELSKNWPQQSLTCIFQQSRTKTGPDTDVQNLVMDYLKISLRAKKLSPVVESNPHGYLRPLNEKEPKLEKPYLLEHEALNSSVLSIYSKFSSSRPSLILGLQNSGRRNTVKKIGQL